MSVSTPTTKPIFDVPCMAKLYETHPPVCIKFNYEIVDKPEVFNITIFHANRAVESRNVNILEGGFRIFPESIDSEFYYMVESIELDDLGNATFGEHMTLMSIKEAMLVAEEFNADNDDCAEYMVVVKALHH